ncbi:hypothetical protein B0H19DRAFT_1087868, partial [Mycena capillaripes]
MGVLFGVPRCNTGGQTFFYRNLAPLFQPSRSINALFPFLPLFALLCTFFHSAFIMINDNSTILPLFHNPRTPPPVPCAPSSKSSSSGSSIEGFVLPLIPPLNDPLRVVIDHHGHRQLPRVSGNTLPVDHERVISLSRYQVNVTAKCASCAELAIECEFSESGIPCAPCAVLAIPDCDFADPY